MIKTLTSYDGCWDFIDDVNGDPDFSEPMLSTSEEIGNNLLESLEMPENRVLGVYEDGALTGLFVFKILEGEKYLEMIVGLSRSAKAYAEIADWLCASCPGYQADFVFNPRNAPLRSLLEGKQAFFYPEQLRMVFTGECPAVDTGGVEPLSEAYLPQYCALHSKDVYWTGEKTAAKTDRFRVYVAIEDGAVAGYIDVTHCFDENEPFDLLVREESRRRGWGRKLLARAIEDNRPKDMALLVDADNEPALRLYESMGFRTAPGRNNQTATWRIEG